MTVKNWNWGRKGGGVEKGEKQAVGRNTGYMNEEKQKRQKKAKQINPLFTTRAKELIFKVLTLNSEVD